MIMCRRPAIVPMAVTTPAAARRPTRRTSLSRPQAQLEQRRIAIDESCDSLAGRQPAFAMLALNRRRTAAQANLPFLKRRFGDQVGERWRWFSGVVSHANQGYTVLRTPCPTRPIPNSRKKAVSG